MTIRDAIVQTLAYTHQFQYPLTETELWQRLIGSGEKYTKAEFKAALAKLIESKNVVFHKATKSYALKNGETFFVIRQQREKWSQPKWKEVTTFLRWARYIPWLSAVAVTGSLAMNNAVGKDDVDFMMITQPRRLWLTRLLVTLIAVLYGKRRTWHGEEQDSWCFNLWLDEDHLAMPRARQNLYTAYEVTQAKFVLDKKNIATQFHTINRWVATWLPNAELRIDEKVKASTTSGNILIDWLETAAFQFQHWYMKSHMTREQVGKGEAFFHPRDTRRLIEERWTQTQNTRSKRKSHV
ncbi:MAG TPA: hypothetical protein VD999_02205 [Vitreimonas sp.]|nr:hypothetical protein [Vitreimonas sp.]